MATEIKLPDLGDGIESGDVLDVLVQEGDTIQKDQGIVEIETDKASVEVPSPMGGTVAKIHVSSGQTLKIGDVILTLQGAGEASAPTPTAEPPQAEVASENGEQPAAQATTEPPPETSPAPPAASAESPSSSPPATSSATPPAKPAAPPAAPVKPASTASAPAPARTAPTTSPKTPLPAGPAIRRFAREVGVDLSTVQGSGEGGRIVREDVLQVVRRANQAAQPAASTPTAASTQTTVAGSAAHATSTPDSSPALPGSPSNDAWGPLSIEPATKIRKTIAAKMHESWSLVPRVTNFDDADVTELEKIRQASKEDYKARGIRLTSMPFVIKSVSMALRDHPLVNASFDVEQGQIIYKQYVNVGIAVDTERGLVVPVIRNSDRKSIANIAKELAVTAERVRTNDFSIDDLRGGSFTISNLGAIGGTYSTPIVNYPEVAILLVGRSRKMPVVVNDEVAVRLMMPLSLSYDHRLVDGATAARFLNDVIGYLQAPGRLLLAP